MPSVLPDPVLALSLTNVQKLNNVDVDQLANLWNVFTKCKESLESGRRLENLSWRLWFREAHLLPPDVSLSDITDYTPLDTPLMSRRGSITGSYPSTSRALPQPMGPSAFSGFPTTISQRILAAPEPLSDPEDGSWSDEEGEIESLAEASERDTSKLASDRGRAQSRSESSPQEVKLSKETYVLPSGRSSKAEAALSTNTSKRCKENVAANSPTPNIFPEAHLQQTLAGSLSAVGDRKRAVSSSSAFGSRARVKQHNTARRRRPLSFQQAIESLILDRSKDFRGKSLSSSVREGMTDVGTDTNGVICRDWQSDSQSHDAGRDADVQIAVQQSSAPAEFSQPNTPSVTLTSPVQWGELRKGGEEKVEAAKAQIVFPPSVAQVAASASSEAKEFKKKDNQSKFFVGGQSVDNGSSSFEDDNDRTQQSSVTKEPEAKRAPSEAASDRSHHGKGLHGHHTKSHTHVMTAANARNRSAVGLSRAGMHAAARGRAQAKGARAAHNRRVSDEVVAQQEPSKETAETAATAGKIRPPVKFTMGGEDEDDFTDEDSEQESKVMPVEEKVAAVAQKTSKSGDDDAEWSSASSTSSEEARKKQKKAEKAKAKAKAQSEVMFQKVPIKSASTANVQVLGRRSSVPTEGGAAAETAQEAEDEVQPVRGLLSSLFHPEEGLHGPPGQLAGRPHASAADLRHRPQRLSDSRSSNGKESNQSKSPSFAAASHLKRVPSTPQVPSMAQGGLKLSKSAVALPVLSTMGSRSGAKAVASKESAVFDDDDADDGSGDGSGRSEDAYGTSEALARLNQLALTKKQRQKDSKRSSASKKRTSTHSLNVEVSPEVNDEAMMAERLEARRSAVATPALASHRSMSHIPETSMPQTPRTTRRNMIRDELSESLRQNLLWERQSRQRMLGIGAINDHRSQAAIESRSRSQVAPLGRNQSVLGGGQLRPLTSSSSVTNVSQQPGNHQGQGQQQSGITGSSPAPAHHTNAAHRAYTGDFHHAGW